MLIQCQGEAAQGGGLWAGGGPAGAAIAITGMGNAKDKITEACMARNGYLMR